MAAKKKGARPARARVDKVRPAKRRTKARRASDAHGDREDVARPTRDAEAAVFPARLLSGAHVFTLDGPRLRLILRKRLGPKPLAELLEKLSLELDDGSTAGDPRPVPLRTAGHTQWVRTADRTVPDAKRIKAIRSHAQVVAVAPVYQRTDVTGARGLMSPHLGVLLVPAALAIENAAELARYGLKPNERIRLGGVRYFSSGDPNDARVFELGARLAERALGRAAGLAALAPPPRVSYEWTPLVSPFAVTPVDPLDPLYDTAGGTGDAEPANKQWNLKRIGARYAWGALPAGQPGSSSVKVLMFDEGVDLQHVDLVGITQLELSGPGPDPANQAPQTAHGTQLAGIVAARHNTSGGAGLAPGCPFTSLRYNDTLIPDAFAVTNTALAAAITHAGTIANSVLLIGMDAGNALLTDATVQGAINTNTTSLIVLATGNDTGTGSAIGYGTVQANVMIVGGYGQTDAVDRNGRWLAEAAPLVGSRVGPEISVAAPAADIMTTTWVSGSSNLYTTAPGLRGTSLAAAHAAGLAALVWSKNLSATAAQIRTQIEQTAAKCGVDRPFDPGVESTAYRTTAGHPNGIWHDHLGYGSIDASAVLVTLAAETDAATVDPERARVIIRDNPADAGVPEPSTGSLVSECDIIVSTNPTHVTRGVITAGSADDLDFSAKAVAAVNSVGAASAYYVFVRVVNIGPAPARGVRVTASLAACATSFMYPDSWDNPTTPGGTTINALNDAPPADYSYLAGPLPVGGVFVARLTVPAGSDFSGFGGHACCVARVVAANDVNFTRASVSGSMAQRAYNNLAQRNLSIV